MQLHNTLWELIVFRSRWIYNTYLRWTILPTWKYNYNLSKEFNEGDKNKTQLLNAAAQLIKRLENQVVTVNTINKKLLEKVRQYARFFDRYGIDKKVLEMDFGSRGSSFNISTFRVGKVKNKKDGKRVRRQEKERKDRRKA